MRTSTLAFGAIAVAMVASGVRAETCVLELRDDAGIVDGEWSGPCSDTRAYGDGTAAFPNGTYWGSAEAGRAHGHGRLFLHSGFRYEGEFFDGAVHGLGSGWFPDGGSYTGRWENGKPAGPVEAGAATDAPEITSREEQAAGAGADGSSREDSLVDDTSDGQATVESPDGGDRRVSDPEDDPNAESVPLGEGDKGTNAPSEPDPWGPEPDAIATRCTLEVGTERLDWSGRCEDGRAQGEGRATALDGSTYVGSAADGRRHGHGTVTTPDGGYYQGGFRDGVHHGEGIFRGEDGGFYRARFVDGSQQGDAVPVEEPASGVSGASAAVDPWGWDDAEAESDPWGPDVESAADPWGADSGATDRALRDPTRSSTRGNTGAGDSDYAAALKALEGTQENARSAPTQGDGNYVSALKELEERAASILREAQQAVDETFISADEDEAEISPGWVVDDREDDSLARLEAERAREERRRKSAALVERTLAIAAAVQTLNREVNSCHTFSADALRRELSECESLRCTERAAGCVRSNLVARCRSESQRGADRWRVGCEEDARSTYQRTISALMASP